MRWPPHINLLYPFLDEDGCPADVSARAAREALLCAAPFRVRRCRVGVVHISAGAALAGRDVAQACAHGDQDHAAGTTGGALFDAQGGPAACANLCSTRPRPLWACPLCDPCTQVTLGRVDLFEHSARSFTIWLGPHERDVPGARMHAHAIMWPALAVAGKGL